MLGRRSVVLLLALTGALLAAVPSLAGGKPDKAPAQPPTDQLIVRLAPGATLDAESLAASAGVDLKKVRRLGDGSYVLKLPKRASADEVQAITSSLAARSDVALAEPDQLMAPLAAVPDDAM